MKQDNILRVGIIGTGWIAQKTAKTLRQMPLCEVGCSKLAFLMRPFLGGFQCFDSFNDLTLHKVFVSPKSDIPYLVFA